MAYALVVWRTDGDGAAIEQALSEIPCIPFFRGLALVREDGVAWNTVRERIRAVVEEHPGTEAVVVMPPKGARVGGWVHDTPPPEDLREARRIMNRAGSTAVPELLATPPIG